MGFTASGVRLCLLADFRESSVIICKLLSIPSQSLSTEVVLVDGMLTLLIKALQRFTGKKPLVKNKKNLPAQNRPESIFTSISVFLQNLNL